MQRREEWVCQCSKMVLELWSEIEISLRVRFVLWRTSTCDCDFVSQLRGCFCSSAMNQYFITATFSRETNNCILSLKRLQPTLLSWSFAKKLDSNLLYLGISVLGILSQSLRRYLGKYLHTMCVKKKVCKLLMLLKSGPLYSVTKGLYGNQRTYVRIRVWVPRYTSLRPNSVGGLMANWWPIR